jgi:hypothetical protein
MGKGKVNGGKNIENAGYLQDQKISCFGKGGLWGVFGKLFSEMFFCSKPAGRDVHNLR